MSDFLSAAAPRASFERYLTRREEKQLLAHVAKHVGLYAKRDYAWIRVALYSGFRVGSLHGLTVLDARQALRIRTLRARPDHAKRGKGYDVPVSLKLEQALRGALKVRRDMRLPDDDDAPLFCSRTGGAMSVRAFQNRLQVWRESAGLSIACSPHWLRHTTGKRVLEATEHRDPQSVVQVVLGHASRQSTVVYTQPDREDVNRAMEEAFR